VYDRYELQRDHTGGGGGFSRTHVGILGCFQGLRARRGIQKGCNGSARTPVLDCEFQYR
jgi:hypothetical protein